MPEIKWRPDLSLGNVLVLVTMLVTLASGWATAQARDDEHDRRLLNLEHDVDIERSRNLEILQRLAAMQADIGYLRTAAAGDRRP